MLNQIIGIAKELGTWIHGQTNEVKHPDDLRTITGLTILQQSQDISDAIVILLIRPLKRFT